MRYIITFFFLFAILISFSSCHGKTDKEKLVDAFQKYITELPNEELEKFKDFRDSEIRFNEFLSSVADKELNENQKGRLYNYISEELLGNAIVDEIVTHSEVDEIDSIKFLSTLHVLLDFEELEYNIWQLRSNVVGFHELSKYGLTVNFIKLDENFANKQYLKIINEDPRSIKEIYQHVISTDITPDKVKSYYEDMGSVSIQLTYNNKLIKDKQHTGTRKRRGVVEPYEIRTIFDVGRICPPICPEKPTGGQE